MKGDVVHLPHFSLYGSQHQTERPSGEHIPKGPLVSWTSSSQHPCPLHLSRRRSLQASLTLPLTTEGVKAILDSGGSGDGGRGPGARELA